MKQTKMYICTLEEFISSRCSHIAVHGWSEILNGIYTGLYTNIWIDLRRHQMTLRCHWISCSWIGCELLLENSWHTSFCRIIIVWETVTLRSRSVKCHSDVCFVPSTLQCQLISPYTLNFSNCWRNNWMLFWQLGSLDDKLGKWINSFFADSVILTNIATNTPLGVASPPVKSWICHWTGLIGTLNKIDQFENEHIHWNGYTPAKTCTPSWRNLLASCAGTVFPREIPCISATVKCTKS